MFKFSTVSTPATRKQTATLRGICVVLPALSVLAAAALLTLSPVSAQVPQQLSQPTAFADPPGRVARMNLAEGPVSYAPADTGSDPRWTPASLNRPLTTGDRLWTGQRARSELHIGSTAVRLGEQTSLDFLELDDDTTQLRLAQGTMQLRVRNLFDGQRIEINTPNLAFVITQPGDYRIDANPATNSSAGTTRVVVQQGAGTIYGDGGAQVNIASGQQANFTDTQLTPAGPAPEVQDGFDAWAHQRDRLEDQSVSARYVPREVVGYQQLDHYGDWNQDPTYGAVWLPRAVPSNWAPYRDGHWSWIAPWGWTWVDDAPWGFAPFHYGRWAQIGPRWGWVPGRLAPRPVYAPALVAFIGGNAGGVNWNVSIGQQGPRPGLGWFPLAPGEAFRPAYRHSPRYITNVNHNIVVNNINVTNNNYRYQRRGDAVSAMSAEDFARGQRVRPEGQRLNPADLGRAQVIAPERGGLPQRVANLRDLPRVASPAALPPAAVAVRPVVTSQALPGQRDDRRSDRREDRREDRRDERREDRNDGRQNDPRDAARVGRPGEALGQWPRPGQPVISQPGAAPDRGALDAEQRARAEQQRQQRELARQQPDRVGGQRPPGEESLGQRALREQAQRNGSGNANGTPNAAGPQWQPGRPDAGRDPIEQAQRDQQRLQRDQQRQQLDAARQQEQQRRQADDSIGQRALQEQAQRQEQARQQLRAQQDQQRQAREQQQQQQLMQQQRQQQDQARQQQAAEQQAQQAQQRAQQDQQRQAREQQQQQQQQQLQRQQQDQARQAAQQQAAQQQAQRQQAQEQQAQQAQQAQQRAQQDQARQQQMAQQQQLQQRAQQEQQRQVREQQQQRQQPDQPREAGRERQSQRRAEGPNGAPPRLDERFNR